MTRDEASMKLAAYVPLLLDRFPDAAFTTASLEHVARRAVRGFPTYGELAEWLGEWWKEHRSPFIALSPPDPEPPRPPPTPEETEHVRRCVAEIVATLRSPDSERPPEPQRPRPSYFTPEQLGRKRHAPANDPAPSADPPAA